MTAGTCKEETTSIASAFIGGEVVMLDAVVIGIVVSSAGLSGLRGRAGDGMSDELVGGSMGIEEM